ncbi:MAG: error-prone DNA polymerase, partial [Phycisphaerae bacterium]
EKKGACTLYFSDIVPHADGVIATLLTNHHDQPEDKRIDVETNLNCATSYDRLRRAARDLHDVFRDRFYIAAGTFGHPDDQHHLHSVNEMARSMNVRMIAVNDVHYHHPQRRYLQDVLTCIRHGCNLSEAGYRLQVNAERHLKSAAQMHRLFKDFPHAVRQTLELARRCTFQLDELRYEYPEALCPPGRQVDEYLAELTEKGAAWRYPQGVPPKVRKQIDHELELIRQLAYEPYFLTVWDIVKFARSRDILCQGRGSAANSAVCYCLGITSVDPSRIDLLFERFVSVERNEPPDIDVDFEHERREEVFQYIYEKYGREHAGIVAEVITYRPRSAIRDVGKTLGLSQDRIDALAQKHDWWNQKALPEDIIREAGFDPDDRTVQMLVKLVHQLLGFPRHLSQHVGGFVITRGPLCEMVPLENGAMEARTFIQWDKDDIDALGILKIDCLALGMLTAIKKCFRMLEEQPVEDWPIHRRSGKANDNAVKTTGPFGLSVPPTALATVPAEDAGVYDMICRADTVGVFQIESRAQMSMLPRLKPRNFYDLVIEVAIVRPGPIQGGMVHPYLKRRNGEEPIIYPSRAIRDVLEKTLGVPLFQEQAMKLAIVAAGFTPGEADQLRRAMAGWRRNSAIDKFKPKLINGMRANGLSQDFAERCFKQICGFGEYGFPESHAASFALLVYVSCYLKRYYPAAFCASIINAQPMGFYHPAQLVRDAQEHGVNVLPVDVNHSLYDCYLERPLAEHDTKTQSRTCTRAPRQNRKASQQPDEFQWGYGGPALRLGMRLIKGISHDSVARMEEEQRKRPFLSVQELATRTGASPALLARLAAANAMRSMGLDRREALWQVLALEPDPPLFEGQEPNEPQADLPRQSLGQRIYQDYDTVGLSLEGHPVALVRKELNRLQVIQNRALHHTPNGRKVRVAGLVLVRQRPATASGITFATIEDETANANLVIRPKVYERYRRAARAAVGVVAEGTVERQGEVIHVTVSAIHDMSQMLARQAGRHPETRRNRRDGRRSNAYAKRNLNTTQPKPEHDKPEHDKQYPADL